MNSHHKAPHNTQRLWSLTKPILKKAPPDYAPTHLVSTL